MERMDQKPQAGECEKEKGKRKYTKPTVISEEIFETVALSCGKLPGQGGSCNAAPRRS
jgi:hypothetical protein